VTRAVAAWALASTACLGTVCLAQDSTGTIEGVVRDTAGTLVSGAVVQAFGNARHAMTDSRGRYRLDSIPPGRAGLRVRRVGYRTPAPETITVARGAVTQADFVMHRVSMRRVVRIPCPAGTVAPDGGVCLRAREVGVLERAPMGVGIISDRETWERLKRRFHDTAATGLGDSTIDWTNEMLVVVSYGHGLAELDEGWGFNRAETRDSTLVITLGPDSIVGAREMFVDGIVYPAAFAITRSSLPVRYEMRVHEGWLPPRVDWRAMLDTTSRLH
jgi:hypothetical protein